MREEGKRQRYEERGRVPSFLLPAVLLLFLCLLPAIPGRASGAQYAGEEHRWETTYTIDREPTCDAEGSMSVHCMDCTAKRDKVVIPKLAHDWSEWTVTKEPKDGKEGARERTCSICKTKETETIDALPHSWGEWTYIAAACDEKGSVTRTCKGCGQEETIEIPALGHQWSDYVVTKKSSCTEDGEQTRTCTVCGNHVFCYYIIVK